jgi:epoxyqueuosine reductase QueG
MGQIGRSNLLLTPEFGPHQRLGAVVTEAELEPDPRRELELCIPDCVRCEEACPMGALRNGRYIVDPCFDYWSTGIERMRPSKASEWPAFMRLAYQHTKYRDAFTEMGQIFITDVDFCIDCMRACPVGERWKDIRPEGTRL